MQIQKLSLATLFVWLNLTLANHAQPKFGQAPPRPTTPHYLCAENRTLKKILLERWGSHEFPLKIYLPTPYQISDTPELHRRAVEAALMSWRRAWPGLSYTFVQQPIKNGIQFVWHTHVPHEDRKVWGSAFLPVYYWTTDRKVLHWSKVNLATKAHANSGIHGERVINLSFREMRDLAIHEIGHALGLPHSDDPNDVMGGGNHFLHTELNMRNISPRDIKTLHTLYSLPYRLKQHPCKHQPLQ